MSGLFLFPKEMRLSQRSDIVRVFKNGKVFGSRDERLFVLCNGMNLNRFLCTFKRGFGKAVQRNRVRRISKEVYRCQKASLKKGFDIVLLLSKYESDFCIWKDKITGFFKTAKLIVNPIENYIKDRKYTNTIT